MMKVGIEGQRTVYTPDTTKGRKNKYWHHHVPAGTVGTKDRRRCSFNWQSCLEGFGIALAGKRQEGS